MSLSSPHPVVPAPVSGAAPVQGVGDVHVLPQRVPSPPVPARPSNDPAHGTDEQRRQQYELELRQHRLEQQAIRRTEITREQQEMAAAKQKEDIYWSKQDARYEAMIKRLQVAEQTSKEMYRYLGKASRVMTQAAEALKLVGQFGLAETGTVRQAAVAQDILAKTTSQYLTEMNERVISHSIQQAGNLAKANSKKLETLLAQGEKVAKEMKAHRLRVHEAWLAYELAVAERQKLELSQKPSKTDPFLAVRAYDRELSLHSQHENTYRQGMISLFNEVRLEDGRRIDAIKGVMLDNLLAQKAVLEHTVKFTDQAIAAVKAIDREQDVLEFALNADLVIPNSATSATVASIPPVGAGAGAAHTAPGAAAAIPSPTLTRTPSVASMTTVFEALPPSRDPRSLYRLYSYEVAHEGTLYRPGKFMKSHWKPVHVAVTTSGFLHYFDDKLNHVPSQTIPLHDCSVALAPNTSPYAFDVLQPNSGFFGLGSTPTTYTLKAVNDTELHEWITAITRYASIAPPQPQPQPQPAPAPVATVPASVASPPLNGVHESAGAGAGAAVPPGVHAQAQAQAQSQEPTHARVSSQPRYEHAQAPLMNGHGNDSPPNGTPVPAPVPVPAPAPAPVPTHPGTSMDTAQPHGPPSAPTTATFQGPPHEGAADGHTALAPRTSLSS